MKKAPLLTLGCAVAACALAYLAGGDADAHELTARGLRQLGNSEFGRAADQLGRAVAGLEVGDPDYGRARMGLVEALAHIDPALARDEFLDAAESGHALQSRDYLTVASTLHKQHGSAAAVQVLDAALARFPQDAGDLERQKEVILEEAASSATPAEIERLRSLGYIGPG